MSKDLDIFPWATSLESFAEQNNYNKRIVLDMSAGRVRDRVLVDRELFLAGIWQWNLVSSNFMEIANQLHNEFDRTAAPGN